MRLPLVWVKSTALGKLIATTQEGIYTICPGGNRHRQHVLRYLPLLSTKAPAEVLGIHSEIVHAQDEAERHNRSHQNGQANPLQTNPSA